MPRVCLDEDHRLVLALSKIKIVMLTMQRIPTVIPMQVGSEVIQTRHTESIWGLFSIAGFCTEHIRLAYDKALVFRPMVNLSGPLLMVISIGVTLVRFPESGMHSERRSTDKVQRLFSVQCKFILRIAQSRRYL